MYSEIPEIRSRKTLGKEVPVAIGGLGAIRKDYVKHLKTLGLDEISPSQLQKRHN